MRHGAAVDPRQASSDATRHLTLAGREDTRRVAATLRVQGLVPTHVFSSPLVRAVQTAEVAAAALGLEGPIAAHPPLVPGGVSAHALAVLDARAEADTVLLVSHEPTVRVLSSHLAGIDFPPFPTSGVAVFERADTVRFLGRVDPRVNEWRGPDDLGY